MTTTYRTTLDNGLQLLVTDYADGLPLLACVRAGENDTWSRPVELTPVALGVAS